MPSLNTLQPEQVAHGTEITVLAAIPGGAMVPLAEVYEIDYDEDESLVEVPILGSRVTGSRQGRHKVSGSIKGYWINQAVRSMLSGLSPVTASGASVASLYHSKRPFNRYDIQITGLPQSPNLLLKNVVFSKDAVKWSEASLSDETINFVAEDVQGL